MKKNKTIKPEATLFFEDKGQDFLEWDVARNKNGKVIVLASRPFQNEIWAGTEMLTSIKGQRPLIKWRKQKYPKELKYKIIKVKKF